jgi:hypothetical protein
VVNMLASGTQVRGFAPDRSRRIFPAGWKNPQHAAPSQIPEQQSTRYEQMKHCKKKSRRGARFFVHVQTGPGAHPASCTMGSGSFPGVKRPGVVLTTHSLLAPRLRMSRAIPLLPLWALGGLYTFTFYPA